MAKPKTNPVPTLGIIELSSIAKGLMVTDLMLKKAEVRLLRAGPVGSGKFMIQVTGKEADLLEAVEEGRDKADPCLVSWTFIPNLHGQVLAALQGKRSTTIPTDALGIVEAQALAALIQAADKAVKTTAVRLLEITFDLDMGGKGYFTLTGDLAEVEAAIATAEALLRKEGAFIQSEILARPHERIQTLVHEGLESLCFSRE
ncbi:MAG: BMC domain-containing protein [Holophagaceae bacterium]|nr:BMC domain-containing protein [Holophagaceae bacterium]